MRLIDADTLEDQIQMAIKSQDEVAEAYKFDADIVKLTRGIMVNVLGLVRKQTTIKKDIRFPEDFYKDDVGVYRLKKEVLEKWDAE